MSALNAYTTESSNSKTNGFQVAFGISELAPMCRQLAQFARTFHIFKVSGCEKILKLNGVHADIPKHP